MERIIIIGDAFAPRALRLDVVASVGLEHLCDGWAVVADLIGGAPPVALGSRLQQEEARALWRAVTDWITHRGGFEFEVRAWLVQRDELQDAGRVNRGRSTPRLKAARRG